MPGSCGQRMYADTLMGIARRKEGNRTATNHDGGKASLRPAVMAEGKFISNLRVSTDKQGKRRIKTQT